MTGRRSAWSPSSRISRVEVERCGSLVGDGKASDDETEGGQHHAADQHRGITRLLLALVTNGGDEERKPDHDREDADEDEPGHRARAFAASISEALGRYSRRPSA